MLSFKLFIVQTVDTTFLQAEGNVLNSDALASNENLEMLTTAALCVPLYYSPGNAGSFQYALVPQPVQ